MLFLYLFASPSFCDGRATEYGRDSSVCSTERMLLSEDVLCFGVVSLESTEPHDGGSKARRLSGNTVVIPTSSSKDALA